jgi:hemoglobin
MAYLCVGFFIPIMTNLNDITTLEDIKLLVDTFYSSTKDFIGPIFNEK